MIIAPSLLAADFLNLQKDLEKLNQTDSEWLHLDVMDGNFVNNISFGIDLIEKVATVVKKKLDVHLMVLNPLIFLDRLIEIKVDYISIHFEVLANFDYQFFLQKAHANNIKIGIVLNPETEVKVDNENIIKLFDYALIMSVHPGKGGQKFIPEVLKKVDQIQDLSNLNKEFFFQIDGGVNDKTIKIIKEKQITCVVAGSYLFQDNMQERINKLR